MVSDDEIQPILENEEAADVKDEGTDTVAGTSTPPIPNEPGDDDHEVEIHLTGCGGSAFCDPRRMPHR